MAIDETAAILALAKLAKEGSVVELSSIRTKKDVQKLDEKTLHRFIADPESRAHLNRAMLIPDDAALAELEKKAKDEADAKAAEEQQVEQQLKVSEETARLQAEAEQRKAAEKVNETVSQVPAWQEEDEANKALGVTTVRDAQGAIVKLVTDYQVTDENGNPVGRPTHLEARNWPELWMKQREAHVQASRAFGRLKSQKVTFKQSQQPKPPSKEELLASIMNSEDPAKAVADAKKATEVTPEQKAARAEADARAALVTYQFLAKHVHDFNNCQANTQLLGEYFQENNLEWTLDNLEVAFKVLEDQLVAPARAVSSPDNGAPVSTATPAATAVKPAAPAAVPAASAPPAASAQPATQATTENVPVRVEPRPGVNSGVQPGSLTAQRIVDVASVPGQLTRREVSKWDAKTLMTRMRDPLWRPQLEAIGIKVIDKLRQG